MCFMTKKSVLDLYFMEARAKLIDIAAFLDRVDRSDGATDFRLHAFKSALGCLQETDAERARHILMSFSDPTEEPVPAATIQGACGAYDPATGK